MYSEITQPNPTLSRATSAATYGIEILKSAGLSSKVRAHLCVLKINPISYFFCVFPECEPYVLNRNSKALFVQKVTQPNHTLPRNRLSTLA